MHLSIGITSSPSPLLLRSRLLSCTLPSLPLAVGLRLRRPAPEGPTILLPHIVTFLLALSTSSRFLAFCTTTLGSPHLSKHRWRIANDHPSRRPSYLNYNLSLSLSRSTKCIGLNRECMSAAVQKRPARLRAASLADRRLRFAQTSFVGLLPLPAADGAIGGDML